LECTNDMDPSPSGIARADQLDSGETDEPQRGSKCLYYKTIVLMQLILSVRGWGAAIPEQLPPCNFRRDRHGPWGRDGLGLPLRNVAQSTSTPNLRSGCRSILKRTSRVSRTSHYPCSLHLHRSALASLYRLHILQCTTPNCST